jgi:hypothetical protein
VSPRGVRRVKGNEAPPGVRSARTLRLPQTGAGFHDQPVLNGTPLPHRPHPDAAALLANVPEAIQSPLVRYAGTPSITHAGPIVATMRTSSKPAAR